MVRLKDHVAVVAGKRFTFQFQYGTIKRTPRLLMSMLILQFQFQYGTIKRDKVMKYINKYADYFNSSMVRLKASIA